MALPDISQILKAPSKIAMGPVSLSTAFPHGGVALGLTQDIVFKPTRAYEMIHEESFGNEVVDVLDLGESVVIAASLRGYDEDAVAQIFPSTISGTVSGKKTVSYPNPGADPNQDGTFRAGTLKSANGIKLIITPDDYVTYPAILIYNAVPLVEETAEIKFSYEEGMIPMLFIATRDSQNRLYQWGRLEDLSL